MPSISALIRNNHHPYGIGGHGRSDAPARVKSVEVFPTKQPETSKPPTRPLREIKIASTPPKANLTVKAVKKNDQLKKARSTKELVKCSRQMTKSGFTPNPHVLTQKCNAFISAATTKSAMMDCLLELQTHGLDPELNVLKGVYCSMTKDEITDALLGPGVKLETLKQLPGATLDEFVHDPKKLNGLALGLSNTGQAVSYNIRMDLLKCPVLAQSFGLDAGQAQSELLSEFKTSEEDAKDLKDKSLKDSRTSRETFGREAHSITESLIKETMNEILAAFKYSASGIKVRQQALNSILYNIEVATPAIKAASMFASKFSDDTLLNPLEQRETTNLETLLQSTTEHIQNITTLTRTNLAAVTAHEQDEIKTRLTKIKGKLELEFISRYVERFPAEKTLQKATSKSLHRRLDKIYSHCRTLDNIDKITVPEETVLNHRNALLECRNVIWGILDDRGEYCV